MNYKDYFKKFEETAEYQSAEQELKPILDLADEILRLRLEKGWSQGELAERADTKQANISRLESGFSNPSVKFLQKLAKALDAELTIHFEEPLFMAVNKSVQADFQNQAAIPINNWPKPASNTNIRTTVNQSTNASFYLAKGKQHD
jgi:transcriptional regulator with XRE-family HTH domain